MAHKVEIELKLELQKSDMRALADSATLRRSAARAKTEELVSTYFDTTKLKLRQHSVSLRIRCIGDRHTQTIKRDSVDGGATLNRDEWECEVEEGTPDFDAARGTALEPLLTRKTRRSLKPIFETVVRRTAHAITLDGTEIELSLDKGSVDDGSKSSAFCEAELELLRGFRRQSVGGLNNQQSRCGSLRDCSNRPLPGRTFKVAATAAYETSDGQWAACVAPS